jgi:hypothetical protein
MNAPATLGSVAKQEIRRAYWADDRQRPVALEGEGNESKDRDHGRPGGAGAVGLRRAGQRGDDARKKTDRDPAKKWAHLTELARQRDVEAAGRAAVADLYE